MGVPVTQRWANLTGQRPPHAPPGAEAAGPPKVRFHDLRHTFATLALQNGVDIKTVSGMLGHFSAGFTLDTYAHVTSAAQATSGPNHGECTLLQSPSLSKVIQPFPLKFPVWVTIWVKTREEK